MQMHHALEPGGYQRVRLRQIQELYLGLEFEDYLALLLAADDGATLDVIVAETSNLDLDIFAWERIGDGLLLAVVDAGDLEALVAGLHRVVLIELESPALDLSEEEEAVVLHGIENRYTKRPIFVPLRGCDLVEELQKAGALVPIADERCQSLLEILALQPGDREEMDLAAGVPAFLDQERVDCVLYLLVALFGPVDRLLIHLIHDHNQRINPETLREMRMLHGLPALNVPSFEFPHFR